MENAITASENTQEKMLHLKLITKKGLLYIEIENSYNGVINEEKGRFYTTKNNKANHGFGLKNVKRIVEKHNGTLDITYSEERFRINRECETFSVKLTTIRSFYDKINIIRRAFYYGKTKETGSQS